MQSNRITFSYTWFCFAQTWTRIWYQIEDLFRHTYSFNGTRPPDLKNGDFVPREPACLCFFKMGISAKNLGDTLIPKWDFRSGGGGRRIRYTNMDSDIGTKNGDFHAGRGSIWPILDLKFGPVLPRIGYRWHFFLQNQISKFLPVF